MNLFQYMQDGAGAQSRAVLAHIQRRGELENSWSDLTKTYQASPEVGRWMNCREQGYVIYMRSKHYDRQLNIAFFEHRNSDSICAVKWEQNTMDAPVLELSNFGDVYKDKWDVSYSVAYSEYSKMGDWIINELEEFWEDSKVKKEEGN